MLDPQSPSCPRTQATTLPQLTSPHPRARTWLTPRLPRKYNTRQIHPFVHPLPTNLPHQTAPTQSLTVTTIATDLSASRLPCRYGIHHGSRVAG
jgi:hypothetical protein